MHPAGKRRKNKKPVTLDEYRRDRDYWKRRALKHQKQLDEERGRHDALVESNNLLRASRDYYRYHMRELCPHNRTNTKNVLRQTYCERCQQLLGDTPAPGNNT